MASKALRGAGVGIAQVGGLLLENALMNMREQALQRMRAEYGMEAERRQQAFQAVEGEKDRGQRAAQHAEQMAMERERIAAQERMANKKTELTPDQRTVKVKGEVPMLMNGKPVMETKVDALGNTTQVPKMIEIDGIYNYETGETKWIAPDGTPTKDPAKAAEPEAAPEAGKPKPAAAAPPQPGAPSSFAAVPQMQPQAGLLDTTPGVNVNPNLPSMMVTQPQRPAMPGTTFGNINANPVRRPGLLQPRTRDYISGTRG